MSQGYGGARKMQITRYKGLGYDLTIRFNTIKEQRGGAAFKKQRQNIDNIINPNMEPLLLMNTYDMDERLDQLQRIRDKMKSARELYEKKMFENEKIHLKVEELNAEAFLLISQIEDDLIRMKTQAPANESAAHAEGRKNMRINFSLRLHDLSKDIRDINMEFLIKSGKHQQIQTSDWYQKIGMDKEMADMIADQVLDEEMQIEAIAKRRDDDITHIAISVEKISSQFKQLHNLVIEQGTILDRIDYNLMKAVENTGKGKRELNSANQRQSKRSGLARKVILIQVILIIFFTFLLFLKYRKRRP